MSMFTRKAEQEQATEFIPIQTLVHSRKIIVHNRAAVIRVLNAWEAAGLHKLTPSKRNKGPHGISKATIEGVRRIDRILQGICPTDNPACVALYDSRPQQWRSGDIIKAIQQLALAAFSADHAPISPIDKTALQKMSLSDFFFCDRRCLTRDAVVNDVSLRKYTPFLYYRINGADPAIAKVSLKEPTNRFLYTSVINAFVDMFSVVPTDVEKNRVADFTDTLAYWYNVNKDRLPPSDRRLDLIVDTYVAYIKRWPSAPDSIIPTIGRTATDTIIGELQRRATFHEQRCAVQAPVYEYEEERKVISGETPLYELATDGNLLSALALYCEQERVEFSAKDVDLNLLSTYYTKQVKDAATAYRNGELVRKAENADWRAALRKYQK